MSPGKVYFYFVTWTLNFCCLPPVHYKQRWSSCRWDNYVELCNPGIKNHCAVFWLFKHPLRDSNWTSQIVFTCLFSTCHSTPPPTSALLCFTAKGCVKMQSEWTKPKVTTFTLTGRCVENFSSSVHSMKSDCSCSWHDANYWLTSLLKLSEFVWLPCKQIPVALLLCFW